MTAPLQIAIEDFVPAAPVTRIVVCLNHFPLEVLPADATRADAERRCAELDAAHRAGRPWTVGRYHHFHTVPEASA